MSRLLASTELLVTADHRMFGICDDGPDGPFSAEIPDDDWIGAGRQEVLVLTTQDLEPIALRIEVWDGDPGTDDDSDTVRVSVPSGRLSINEITGGIRPDAFRLPAAGDYAARLSISLPEESEETTESVVARFWPVAGT